MRRLRILIIATAGLFAACSSSEQNEENLENDMDEGAASNAEGDSGQNNESSENAENAEGSSEQSESNEVGSNGDAATESDSETSSYTDTNGTDSTAATETPYEDTAAVAMPEAPPASDATALPLYAASTTGAGGDAPPVAAAATPPASLWDANRVVRFINADETPIYTSTQADSATVGALRKGDHVMVILQGEWAMVTESAYIPGAALSASAVPRTTRQANWMPPSE